MLESKNERRYGKLEFGIYYKKFCLSCMGKKSADLIVYMGKMW